MKKLVFIIVGLMLLSSMLVSAVPGTIDSVKIDGDELFDGDINKLSIERGQDFDVKVRVTANSAIRNAEVVAFITGFDFNRDTDRISDSSGVFDLTNQNSAVKTLHLTIPDRADKDDYMLRVIFSDRNGDEVVKNYRLSITPPRHSVTIRDVILNPMETVEAGRSLLVSVRMKNIGDKDEDDIKVTISIPDLGLSQSDFVKEVQSDESATSEELFFRIPVCAKAGTYPVQIELEYDDGFRFVSEESEIRVVSGDMCANQGGSDNSGSETLAPSVMISPSSVDVLQGEGGSYFTATISNPASSQKSYFISADSMQGVQVRFSPSTAIVVPAGDTQNVFVYVAATDKTPTGSQVMTISVKDASGRELKSSAVRVDVRAGKKSASTDLGFNFDGDMVQMLGIGLLVLLIILFVLGVYLVFGQQPPKKSEPQQKVTLNKTYY